MARIPILFAALVALGAAPAAPQDVAACPPSPFDRSLPVELRAPAPDGAAGPADWIELRPEFAGTLHLWVEGGRALSLRAESADGASLGQAPAAGGQLAYLRLEVEPGQALRLLVDAPGAAEPAAATLQLRAAPESEATRAAATAYGAAIASAQRELSAGAAARARELLAAAQAELRDVPGAETSQRLAEAWWQAGQVWYPAGDPAGAAEALGQTLRHRLRVLPPDHADALLGWMNVGTMRWLSGDPRGAEPLLARALAGFERAPPADRRVPLMISMNLGSIRRELGDLEGASRILGRVVEGFESSLPAGDKLLLDALHNLAAVREDLGDLEGARAAQERVLEGYEATLPEDDFDLQRARSNLAHTLDELGELEGARDLFELVLEVREARLIPENPALLATRLNLAGVVSALGDHARARALLERALADCAGTLDPDTPDVLRAGFNLAGELAQAGDLEGAARLGRQVLEGFERVLPEDHRDRLLARKDLALTEFELGHVEVARALAAELIGDLQRRTLRAGLLAPREAREVLATDTGLVDACLFLAPPSSAELARAAFELVETRRRVATALVMNAPRVEADPELRRLSSEAAAARSALNDSVLGSARGGGAAAELRATFESLSVRRDSSERALRTALAERGAALEPITLGALCAALSPESALVAYLRFGALESDEESGRMRWLGEHLLAHVVCPDGSLTRVDLGPAAELEQLVADWRAALGKPLERGVAPQAEPGAQSEREAGVALRRRLLDPLLQRLGPQTTRLRVLADDLVYLVPLGALPLDAGAGEGGIVDDRYTIAPLDSLAALPTGPRPASGPAQLLVLGNPAYDAEVAAPAASAGAPEPNSVAARGAGLPQRFAPLMQTAFEVEAVAACFRKAFAREPEVLVGEDAGKAALRERARNARFLHLATHGWFAPQTVRSELDAPSRTASTWRRADLAERVRGFAPMTLCGLALAGANRGRDARGGVPGILTAEELCALDLAGCELAVLSACETQVGLRRAGQGIQSLQAAVHAAGARTSITSLWRVDDAVARRWMELFYAHLWAEGRTALEALRRTRRDLRDEGFATRDWAAWVIAE